MTTIAGIPSYLIYAIPVIIIVAIAVFWILKRRAPKKKENLAMIYSVLRRSIVDIRPFTLDADKSQATFISETKPKETKTATFDPILAVYNVKAGGYFTIFAEENYVQLPLISGNPDYLNRISMLEKNVEKRVSRLNACQLAIHTYVHTSTPHETYGKLEVLNLMLLFVALLAIAYCISSVVGSVSSAGTLIKALHGIAPIVNSTQP